MLDQLNRINMLYDIYAPLLTDRQQEILRLYFSDNYSLGEIAEEFAISRQAVHDLIRRAVDSIERLEEKLGLYRLFTAHQELLSEAEALLDCETISKNDVQRLKTIIAELRTSSEQ